MYAMFTVWPCWGDPKCNEDDPVLMVSISIFFAAFALMMVGHRVQTPASLKLLERHERSGAAEHTYTSIDVIRASVAGFLMLMLVTSQDQIQKILDDPYLKARDTTTIVLVCHIVTSIGFPIIASAAFDAVLSAARWLKLTKRMYQRFSDDVCAVAASVAAKVDLEAGRVLPIAVCVSEVLAMESFCT